MFRTKHAWEVQIAKLGGRNFTNTLTPLDGEGVALGKGGYRYFGAAKNLPDVQQAFEQEKVAEAEARRELKKLARGVNCDYYGWREDEDEELLKAEAVREVQLRREFLGNKV